MRDDTRKSLSVAEDVLKKSLAKGCDAAEVYITQADDIAAEAKDGAVDALDSSRDFGVAVKVIKMKRLGFSFTTLPDQIDETIREAFDGANSTSEDAFLNIPGGNPPSDVLAFDDALRKIGEGDVIGMALELEEHALAYDERVKKVRKAEVSIRRGHTVILNSRGVRVAYESGYISASLTLLTGDDKGNSQMGWDFDIRRRVSDLDTALVASSAAERAIGLLGSRIISPVKVPVILPPHIAVQFLDLLSTSLSAEAVQKKRSFLEGKIGQKVISGSLDIVDDGILEWGVGTRPVDDEGVPSMKKTLISRGVLEGYVHNAYTAAKAGTASTGNASRSGYKSLPGVAMTNLFVRSGKADTVGAEPEELSKRLKRGILITDVMGMHTANSVSGDFSVGISGIWLEQGEKAYPVKEAVMSGNILDLFSRVEEMGSDLRFYGNTGSPSLLIGEMDISA